MDTFEGAVMIADITGFTKLTEELSKKGPSGVELLTKCMNNFFSQVPLLLCRSNLNAEQAVHPMLVMCH